MTPAQATSIIDIIGELWPITAKHPDKGGYTPRMLHELKDKIHRYPYEAAEAILSAMWAEKGNQYGPKIHELVGRLSEVQRAEGLTRNDGRAARDTDRSGSRPMAHWKEHLSNFERFAAMVGRLNREGPGKGDAFAKGCRQRWGDDYGRSTA